jgi:ferritin-like protein
LTWKHEEEDVGTTATELSHTTDIRNLINQLDELHNANMVVMHWCHAVQNRLEGQALYLLNEELSEVAGQSLADARRLADRIAELGGAITGDPDYLVERSPFDMFALPDDPSAVGSILGQALQQLRTLIRAYAQVVDIVRGRDDLTYRLVVDLLGHAVRTEDEIEAALSGSRSSPSEPLVDAGSDSLRVPR